MPSFNVVQVSTTPYEDQKPGTSGLRKPTRVFINSPNYAENFIQSTLNTLFDKGPVSSLVLGGDGRYFTREAYQIIFKICLANKISKIYFARNGLMSTPTASYLIRKRLADGAFILTASHNPGGIDGDFGIKFNNSFGAPATEEFTQKIFEHTKKITSYFTCKCLSDVNIALTGTQILKAEKDGEHWSMSIEFVDAVAEYMDMASKEFFNWSKIDPQGSLLDSMHGVMGPYIKRIFCEKLGLPPGCHLNAEPKPDFGKMHPDPNLHNAQPLIEKMKLDSSLKFACAFDGDGDRNMVLGENGFFVTPGDSLAVIVANSKYLERFQGKLKGVARSMPTAPALDRYAKANGIQVYETPTGWKFFCDLFDSGMISICGEESFGLGADHIREKDGMWACLAWLEIMYRSGKSIRELVIEYWSTYGRDYFCRYDYDVSSKSASKLMEHIKTFIGKPIHSTLIKDAIDWEYINPVTQEKHPGQGVIISMQDGSKVTIRMSGTSSANATIRMYFTAHSMDTIDSEPETYMAKLIASTVEILRIESLTGKKVPDCIT